MLFGILLSLQLVLAFSEKVTLKLISKSPEIIFSDSNTDVELECTVAVDEGGDRGIGVVWRKDNEDFAERCLLYTKMQKKFSHHSCTQEEVNKKLVYRYLIKNVNIKDRGSYTCVFGKDLATVDLKVDVPAIVAKPLITAINDNNFIKQASDRGTRSDTSIKGLIFGEGTRYDPLDLTQTDKGGASAITIECQTSCSTSKNNLVWVSRNMTQHSFVAAQSMDPRFNCQAGLTSVRERVSLSCEYGRANHFSSSQIKLIGLNRISCLSDNGRTVQQVDQTLRRMTGGVANGEPVYNSEGSLQKLQYSSYDPECINNGKGRTSCVYVLCPGPPRESFLTYGEKIAIGLSVVLLIALSALLCCFTRERKAKKQRAKKRMQTYVPSCPQNFIPDDPYMGYAYQC
ncbi:hypothetical protein Ciccas_006250 [Cichlidogyrus casuarinus]|uniref:Ig-like domain-containing protein n=1 Tax=Cichlidogyrus casuarinus TaxID=1844966 RepID=A0ABD2Q6B3_9PLAT